MKKIMQLPDFSIDMFDYELPDEYIAKYPLAQRDESKLLVHRHNEVIDDRFNNLFQYLPNNSLLVVNNTKVIRARLFFQKATGASIEIFVLDPANPADYALSFQQTKQCSWKCMVGNQKKWKSGALILPLQIQGANVNLCAQMEGETENGRIISFSWDNPRFTFSDVLENAGNIPIPPYLNRESEEGDLLNYQTVYSKIKGSVAAPTAGLHFTDQIMAGLQAHGVQLAELTLHVGAGTFQPVKSEQVSQHQMHNELIVVKPETIVQLLKNEGNTIAVGTTSVRTLESLYWLGVKLLQSADEELPVLKLEQWDAYSLKQDIPLSNSLASVLKYLENNKLSEFKASTCLMIVPGYRFRVVNGMFTNFHQPKSTLLLLVSAFIGENWKKVYQHALQNNYRFLSYGDSNLYLP